jgi:RNA-directed DNA polymerase
MQLTIAEGRGSVISKRNEGNGVIQRSKVNKATATKLIRVELKSRSDAQCVFNNLGHIIDAELLRGCFRDLEGSKAVGIDSVTKDSYGRNFLKEFEKAHTSRNLEDLLKSLS